MTMVFEKSTRIILCPSSSVPVVSLPITCITSSCSSNKQRTKSASRLLRNQPWLGNWTNLNPGNSGIFSHKHFTRRYASVSGPDAKRPLGAASTAGHTWPSWPDPTPYDIFSHPKDAKYNKALFYELVKIYHPDRHHTAAESAISHSVRLERYRLVVAANEILSDPAKRKAYDLHGSGWNGKHSLESLYREADETWRHQPGNASKNATWEDWDRWHRERNGEKQPRSGVFMSNELFVLLLCSFVVLGSLTQARRANSSTLNLVEMRDKKHAEISESLRLQQQEKASLGPEERVERFLRQRESWIVTSPVYNNSPSSASQGK
ncbi:hypothetical protein GGS20DRAFT_483445 [Poronia punctata]|nr:hypothetical protein GGS20DRAFT_483445 [Poronia punctata]